MWEVFTCGKMPYGRLKNTEVVERVQRGIILERPKACFKEVYEVCHSPNYLRYDIQGVVDATVSSYNSVTSAVREKCQRRKINDPKSTVFVGPCFF